MNFIVTHWFPLGLLIGLVCMVWGTYLTMMEHPEIKKHPRRLDLLAKDQARPMWYLPVMFVLLPLLNDEK